MDPKYFNHFRPDLSKLDPLDWFDNSILDSFLDCNRYAWYERIHSLDIGTPNMAAGTVLHAGMEIKAATGSQQKADLALAKAWQDHRSMLEGQESRFEFQNLHRVFQMYQEKYANDPILYSVQEWPFALKLEDANQEPFWLVGKSDGFGGYLNDEWVVERKSAKSIRADYLTGLAISRQASTYTYAARRIIAENGGDPKRIRGALYDIIAFSDTKVDFLRNTVLRNDNELDEWLSETRDLVANLRKSFRGIDKMGKLPNKNRNQCTIYGACPFLPICAAYENQRDKTIIPGVMKNFRKRTPWRPI